MSENINNDLAQRQEVLKKIIKDLHAGVPVKKLQKTFAKLIENTSPDEIAEMENALIKEGFPVEEVLRLCDVHAQVFEKSLAKVGKPSKIPGHPLYTFMEENIEVKKILKSLSKSVKKLKKGSPKEKDEAAFKEGFKRFTEIEKHYQRKENQLFPVLEEKKFTGPTQVMWGKHDEIRQFIKETESAFNKKEWDVFGKRFKTLASAVKRLIFLEEKILFPTAAKKINVVEWAKIKQGGPEIGYAWITPSNLWDAELAKSMKTFEPDPADQKPQETEKGSIPLSQGKLTAEQIDLMLKNLPFDLSYVDENDRVQYYSDTKERLFPRSPAIIGRTVQNCHPPKSVHVVENIVKNFREKKKTEAEFWIQKDGLFIHIRYFPLYDKSGNYKGVIEVSQEVSGIRALEGERRIVDW